MPLTRPAAARRKRRLVLSLAVAALALTSALLVGFLWSTASEIQISTHLPVTQLTLLVDDHPHHNAQLTLASSWIVRPAIAGESSLALTYQLDGQACAWRGAYLEAQSYLVTLTIVGCGVVEQHTTLR